MGVAPHQFLVDLRLKKAAALLLTSDLDVATIAATCGYAHPGRFALAFRKQFSVSPSVYRQHQRSKPR